MPASHARLEKLHATPQTERRARIDLRGLQAHDVADAPSVPRPRAAPPAFLDPPTLPDCHHRLRLQRHISVIRYVHHPSHIFVREAMEVWWSQALIPSALPLPMLLSPIIFSFICARVIRRCLWWSPGATVGVVWQRNEEVIKVDEVRVAEMT